MSLSVYITFIPDHLFSSFYRPYPGLSPFLFILLRAVFFGRSFGVGHNFMGPRLGEGYNFWAPFIKTLGDCGVNPENSLDDENGETKANNNTETNNN